MNIVEQLRAENRLARDVQEIKDKEWRNNPKSLIRTISESVEPLKTGLIKARLNNLNK